MRRWLLLALIAGCKKDTAPPVSDDTDPGEESAETAEPLLDLTGKVGAISLMHIQPWADDDAVGYAAAGLFVQEDDGILNGAACILLGGLPCLDDLGALDGAASINDLSSLTLTTFYVGDTVTVGGVNLSYAAQGNFDLYFGQPTAWSTGDDLSLDGDFAPYAGSGNVAWAAPLVVTSPETTEDIVVGSMDDVISLAWEAGGGGDIVAALRGEAWHLTDDGAFDLPLEGAAFQAPFDQGFLVVSRIVSQVNDAAGNDVRVTTSSDQYYRVSYQDTEGWTELLLDTTVAETCDDAAPLAPVGAGQYWFDATDADDNHDVGDGNDVTGYSSAGPDVVIPVALLDGDRLTVTARHASLDTSIYLLDDGCDEGDALDGADETLGGEEEEFSYTARADGTVYVVVDAYDSDGDGRFGVVIEINGD